MLNLQNKKYREIKMKEQKYFMFWWRWLIFAVLVHIAFGFSMFLMPETTNANFSFLVYGNVDTLKQFGQEPYRYINYIHSLLGAIALGWGISLFYIILKPLYHQEKDAWFGLAFSILCWFLSDTGVSLVSGYWQNAILNLVFLIFYFTGLVFIFKYMKTKIIK